MTQAARSPSPPSRRPTATTWRRTSPRPKASCAKRPSAARKSCCRRSCSRASTFCTRQDPKWFATALPVTEHPCVLALQEAGRRTGVVIPISFFEKDGPRYYNSVAIADADGEILGVYRKSHIPDGPGYQEKYYFRPGDTGFKAWTTKLGTHRRRHLLGPVVPRVRARDGAAGAEVLFYPTAIGSEPYDTALDTHAQWQRAMQGHAVANAVPVVAANRIGLEDNDGAKQKFYGHRSSPTIAANRRELRRKGRGRARAHVRSRSDRKLSRRLGLFPRPPHRSLRQEHRLVRSAHLTCNFRAAPSHSSISRPNEQLTTTRR